MLHVSLDHDFVSSPSEWNRVVSGMNPSPFFMLQEYQQAWWHHLKADRSLHILSVRDEVGALVGALPLYQSSLDAPGRWQLLGGTDESDYLDIIAESSQRSEVYAALISALQPLAWNELHLTSLHHQSSTLVEFQDLARQQGWEVEQIQQTICPIIDLPKSWEQYLSLLETSFVSQLRKHTFEVGVDDVVSYRLLTQSAEVAEAIPSFIQLHKQSGTDKAAFWTTAREHFFVEMASELAKKGLVRLYFLDLTNDPAAATLIFDYQNQFLLYNSGFNAYRYGHLSVGTVLVAHTIQEAIALGRSHYDFMRGEESYKFQFGAVAQPLYDLHIKR